MIRQAFKSPAIDIDMLTMALQAGDLDTGWWLDTHSGDVIPAPAENGDALDQQLIDEQQTSPDRYIVIEPISESVHLELMESYIATLEEEEICESLYQALEKNQPVWHFKNALSGAPECEDNWYAFKEQFYALQARQWLRDRYLDYREVAQNPEQENSFTADLFAGEAKACLDMSVNHQGEQRRYLVSQQDSELVLTLFVEQQGQQQLLAESSINQNQLDGINHILETYRAYIDVNANERALNVQMIYRSAGTEGEVRGCVTDEPFRTLIATLDMLLGVPSLKA
jgi:hypothetical protein